VIGLPRSTYYYRAQEGSVTLTDSELEELIGTVQDELPGYGYRRVTHELRRRGHVINHKRVARVMRAKGMGIKRSGAMSAPPRASTTARFSPTCIATSCLHSQTACGWATSPTSGSPRGSATWLLS
jgi:transposase InsO family protein